MTSYVIPKSKYRDRPTFHHINAELWDSDMWSIDATLYNCYCGEYFAEDVIIKVNTNTNCVTINRFIGDRLECTYIPALFDIVLPKSTSPTNYQKLVISKFVRKVLEQRNAR